MTMITPSYLGETIEYSSLHACRSTLEDPTPVHVIHRISLKPADHNRLVILAQHASAFAKLLHRAHTSAGCSQQVGLENCPGGPDQVIRSDFLDEARDVDVSGTGVGARCVVAIQTAVGFDQCFVLAQGRQRFGESLVHLDLMDILMDISAE